MVSSGAKPIALSHPMEPSRADALWDEFESIAGQHEVKLFREDAFPETALFPAALTAGKSVILIYKGNRLTQYQQLKSELSQADPTDVQRSEVLGRRFGRLLGYDSEGINRLLTKTSGHRTLASFGVDRQTTHFYYENLEEARRFYLMTLGLKTADSVRFQISEDAYIALHPLDGEHPKDQPKSTAIAFLTDQLPEWYALLQEREVSIKYTYQPRTGGAHDGFVALDPGGYLLEFEQFKQHPENEVFMSVLTDAPKILTADEPLNFFGSITWTYHRDLLKMQRFYEEVLGFTLVADQGWTKIYQTAPNSYVGLVDECRGMENYSETKAVELQWNISDGTAFQAYAKDNWIGYSYLDGTLIGPDLYHYILKTGK
jgi:catechol 2,3-dioxygenase-like lactoylglutathione lyase family enzyme